MSVLESRYPILILSHHNCEIYCCHLDGYKNNQQALICRLNQIETELLKKAKHIQFRIWFNVDESTLDPLIMKLIVESIYRFKDHIYKIAFIGLRGMSKWRFEKIRRNAFQANSAPISYFTDAERAKDWLI
jgi:hemolysin-activating ACP:hemolysin acyltransferase